MAQDEFRRWAGGAPSASRRRRRWCARSRADRRRTPRLLRAGRRRATSRSPRRSRPPGLPARQGRRAGAAPLDGPSDRTAEVDEQLWALLSPEGLPPARARDGMDTGRHHERWVATTLERVVPAPERGAHTMARRPDAPADTRMMWASSTGRCAGDSTRRSPPSGRRHRRRRAAPPSPTTWPAPPSTPTTSRRTGLYPVVRAKSAGRAPPRRSTPWMATAGGRHADRGGRSGGRVRHERRPRRPRPPGRRDRHPPGRPPHLDRGRPRSCPSSRRPSPRPSGRPSSRAEPRDNRG